MQVDPLVACVLLEMTVPPTYSGAGIGIRSRRAFTGREYMRRTKQQTPMDALVAWVQSQ